MSHIVVYKTDDGSSGFEPCESLDDAIVVAERMRNVDGVASPRIFRMEEVHIDFRPYYRVEVADSEGGDAVDEAASAPVMDDLPAPPAPEAVAEAEAQSGAAMSSDGPAWVEPHDAGDDGDPDHDHADETEMVVDADEAESGSTEDVEADDPSAPVAESHDHTSDDVDDSDDSDDDAMISVRRGLFGR